MSDGGSSDSNPSEDNLDDEVLLKIVPKSDYLIKKIAKKKKELKRQKEEKIR